MYICMNYIRELHIYILCIIYTYTYDVYIYIICVCIDYTQYTVYIYEHVLVAS